MKLPLVFIIWLVATELFAASSILPKEVGSIEGTVIDRSTHQSIPGVIVKIVETSFGTVTDI